jgi:hypothetical protein
VADEPTPTVQLPLVYVNAISVSGSPIDMAIDLGYRGPDGSINYAVRVAMAWEHAALMHDILGQALERYRNESGEIRDIQKMAGVHVDVRTTGAQGE